MIQECYCEEKLHVVTPRGQRIRAEDSPSNPCGISDAIVQDLQIKGFQFFTETLGTTSKGKGRVEYVQMTGLKLCIM